MMLRAAAFVALALSLCDADFRKAKVDLYLLSLCPDTIKFIKEQFWPNFEELRDLMDVSYIVYGLANTTEVDCASLEIQPPLKPFPNKPDPPIRALRFRKRRQTENSTEANTDATSELIQFVNMNPDDPISSSLLEIAPQDLLNNETDAPSFAKNKDIDIEVFKDTPRCYKFECYHGPEECTMNMYMNCGMEKLRERKQQKQIAEQMRSQDDNRGNCSCSVAEFLHCAFGKKNISDAEECSQLACIDHGLLTACSRYSQVGTALHAAAGQATKAFRNSLPPSQKFTVPSIAINGKLVKKAEKNFKAEVLASMGFKRGMCERVAGMLNQLAPFLNVPCF